MTRNEVKGYAEMNEQQDESSDTQCEGHLNLFVALRPRVKNNHFAGLSLHFVSRGGTRNNLQNKVFGGILQNAEKPFAIPK